MTDAPTQVSRIARTIDRVAASIGACILALLALLIVYVVTSRYLFSSTPRWSEEIPRLLLVWLTFIGAISAFARGTHLSAGLTDLILAAGRLRRAVAALATLSSALLLIVLLWTGVSLTARTWAHETTALSWPVGLTYLALPVASAFSLLVLALSGWRR